MKYLTLFMILLTAGLMGGLYWYLFEHLWNNSMLVLSTEKLLGGG